MNTFPHPPSLGFFISVFFVLGPVLIFPVMLIFWLLNGVEYHFSIGGVLTGWGLMWATWWIGATLGAPFGGWVFTLAPTFATSILFWLISKPIFTNPRLYRERPISRVILLSMIGAAVSIFSYWVITISYNYNEKIMTLNQWSISGLSDLSIVATIGAVLGLIIGLICEWRLCQDVH